MRVANFSATIPEGREKDSAHVVIPHGTKYTLRLQNHHNSRRTDAAVTIDGKPMGVFRLDAGRGSITLERPAHDEGRFTFYAANTEEYAAAAGGAVAADDRGLVRVVFRPEKAPAARVGNVTLPPDAFDRQGSNVYPAGGEQKTSGGIVLPLACRAKSFGGPRGQSVTAGVTGLSGHSRQKFTDVEALDYDPGEEVTITLRLVAAADGPRPLTAAVPRSNPVPAPVG